MSSFSFAVWHRIALLPKSAKKGSICYSDFKIKAALFE
jgi:hypothetical protein